MPMPRSAVPIEQGCQYKWRGDADTEREGILILMARGCQYQGVLYQGSRDADANREGMPMPKSAIPMEQGCQYQWRGDANTKECYTYGVGMPIPMRRDADAKCYQITMPVTQNQSVILANWCER
jgi:hypothetical protein